MSISESRSDFADLRLLYSSPHLSAAGGPAAHGTAFINAARDLGAAVFPVGAGHSAAKAFSAGAARAKRGRSSRWTVGHEIVRLGRNALRDIGNAAGLARVAAASRCNVVLARTTPVDLFRTFTTSALRLPLVLEVNTPMAIELGTVYPHFDPRLQAFVERNVWRRAARIVTVSNELRDILIGLGVDSTLIRAAPNGTDVSLFDPSVDGREWRARLKLEHEDFVVGFVGGLMPWHGVQVLFAAVSLLAPTRQHLKVLVIGGEGSDSAALTEAARSVSIEDRLVWLPNQRQSSLPGILAACDVCTAPYRRLQPFYFSPLKVFEYMAMQKPTVGSAQGQLRDLLSDDRGVLVPPDDPIALADAIALLANDPKLRARLGQNAREWVVRHGTWHRCAATVLGACREALLERCAA